MQHSVREMATSTGEKIWSCLSHLSKGLWTALWKKLSLAGTEKRKWAIPLQQTIKKPIQIYLWIWPIGKQRFRLFFYLCLITLIFEKYTIWSCFPKNHSFLWLLIAFCYSWTGCEKGDAVFCICYLFVVFHSLKQHQIDENNSLRKLKVKAYKVI